MNLLDEWDQDGFNAYGEGPADLLLSDDGLDDVGDSVPAAVAVDTSVFALETVERLIARGRGQVSSVAAACDCVVVATTRAYIIRYDFSQGSTPVAEIELSRLPDASIHKVWMDPSGNHVIATVHVGTSGNQENHYINAKWKKSRLMSKLKGVPISAVGWPTHGIDEHTTGEVLIATEAASIHELALDEKDKKERTFKQLFELEDREREPFLGIAQQRLANSRTLALVVTPTRLYAFAGSGTLEAVFAMYHNRTEMTNFIELPGEHTLGELHLHTPSGRKQADRFAWLAEPGIYHGFLALSPPEIPTSELGYLDRHELLAYPGGGPGELPLSMAQTQFHYVLLFPNRLQFLNRVSHQMVQEIPLPTRNSGAYTGVPLGLCADQETSTIYLYTGEGLLEVTVQEEGRDMWRVYLEKGEFQAAIRNCRTQAQRDAVHVAEAEAAFTAGRFKEAAALYGKVTAPSPSFEEVALKIVEAGVPDALQVFLLTKLEVLGSEDKAQATMVATWLTELYLDQMNRALLEEAGEAGDAVQALSQQLRDFLKSHCHILDVNVTISLLAGYGRLDDLMHYATYRQDNETVLEYLLGKGEAQRALAVLRRPGVSQELFYKFAPALMSAAPGDTVEAWLAAQPPLDPRRMLPALLRFAQPHTPPEARAQALRYIQFCTGRLGSEDPAIHQLAVALLALEPEEAALGSYLATARDALGRPLFDPHFALRLARQSGKLNASVQLFCELGMFEDAVALALTFDMALAQRTASRPEDDEALQRKLWLLIGRHIINAQPAGGEGGKAPAAEGSAAAAAGNINKINDFLREAGGLIKIEDILPLFPDFVQIDAFKEAICQSLEDYNAQIEQLKSEMQDATRIADALRRDMAVLEQRSATLDLSEPCARCGIAMAEPPPESAGPSGGAVPPFFLFPTGNAFHTACLCAEVCALASGHQRNRIQGLLARLSQLRPNMQTAPATAEEPAASVDALKAQLEEQVAAEDPYCGEIVVRNIDKPFIEASEQTEVASWQI